MRGHRWAHSGEASIILARNGDGEIVLTVTDPEVFIGSESFGPVTEWDDDEELAREIADGIDREIERIAEKMVKTFRAAVVEADRLEEEERKRRAGEVPLFGEELQ